MCCTCKLLFCLGIFSKNLMTFRRAVSFRQSTSLSSEQNPSNLYGMLPEFGVCNMNPINNDQACFTKWYYTVPHLLVDFFCHVRAFSKVPPLMWISQTITSGTLLTLMYRTKSKRFSAISFGLVAIFMSFPQR